MNAQTTIDVLMDRKTWFILILLACVMMPQLIPAQTPVKRRVDVLTLRFLLANRQYEELNTRLNAYQAAFEKDVTREKEVLLAINAFSVFDGNMERLLNEWIRYYPSSAVAYAARSSFYLAAAWEVRGSALASQTNDEQFKKMEAFLVRVGTDANKALELNPKLSVCQVNFISMFTLVGQRQSLRTVLENALKLHPASLLVRGSYLWSLLPQWGGSYEEMNTFAVASQEFAAENSALSTLQGYVDADKGSYLQRMDRQVDAVEYFDRALKYGKTVRLLTFRGISYGLMKEYEKALKDFEEGLEIDWQDVDLLAGKAQALRYMRRGDEARRIEAYIRQLQSFAVAATQARDDLDSLYGDQEGVRMAAASMDDSIRPPSELQAGDQDALSLARELFRMEKYSEAVEAYTAAAAAAPDNPRIYFGRGTAYLHMGNYENAIADLEKSISLDAKDVRSYYNLGWVFLRLQQYQKGEELNDKAISLNRGFGEAYMNRSFARRMLGRIDEANTDLLRACELKVERACALVQQQRGTE